MAAASRPLQLFGMSLRVLRRHRALVMFPLISLAASLVVIAASAGPVFAGAHGGSPGAAGWIVLVIMYLVLSCITVFCNAALIFCADQALRGANPTVSGGFRAASGRKGVVLGWGLVSGTISIAFRLIEQRLGLLGQVIGLTGGLAWGLVTYLVLPLIVLENLGPREGMRRSAQLFKSTWGDRVAGQVGIGYVGILLFLPALLVFAVLAALLGAPGAIAGGVLAAVWLLTAILLTGAVSGIYQTALYRFAADGSVPAAFGDADLSRAFRPKRR